MTVYCIREEGTRFCKIGFTAQDVAYRLADLQTGNPRKLYVEAFIAGDETLEAELHAKFGQYRRAGEWFDDSGGNIVAWFRLRRASVQPLRAGGFTPSDYVMQKYAQQFPTRPTLSYSRVASMLCVSRMTAKELIERHDEITTALAA